MTVGAVLQARHHQLALLCCWPGSRCCTLQPGHRSPLSALCMGRSICDEQCNHNHARTYLASSVGHNRHKRHKRQAQLPLCRQHQHGATQHCTAQHSTAQHSTAQHNPCGLAHGPSGSSQRSGPVWGIGPLLLRASCATAALLPVVQAAQQRLIAELFMRSVVLTAVQLPPLSAMYPPPCYHCYQPQHTVRLHRHAGGAICTATLHT
jgi:hypothetical protein